MITIKSTGSKGTPSPLQQAAIFTSLTANGNDMIKTLSPTEMFNSICEVCNHPSVAAMREGNEISINHDELELEIHHIEKQLTVTFKII